MLTNQLQAAKHAHRHEADQVRQQLATAPGELTGKVLPGNYRMLKVARDRTTRGTAVRDVVVIVSSVLAGMVGALLGARSFHLICITRRLCSPSTSRSVSASTQMAM